MNKKTLRDMLRRRVIMILLIVFQLALFGSLIVVGGNTWRILAVALQLFSLFAALHVITRSDNTPFKLMWVIIILVFPLFGGVFYVWSRISLHDLSQKVEVIGERSRRLFLPEGAEPPPVPQECPAARYLQEHEGFPAYTGTRTEYLSPGEAFFAALIPVLQGAEKYIYLEFFIIENGVMWDTVLSILKSKARSGVDVRLIYDDVGCFLRLPKNYPQELEKLGIKCRVFNPFRPMLSAVQNNRDHRKIISVDGRTAFTGGINIADEYINEKERFGHWKDCALRLDGEAAWSLTVIFLEMWRLVCSEPDDFESMRPKRDGLFRQSDGYVMPFADSPLDREHLAAHVFLNMIYNAREYIYINTPYLVLDDGMANALCYAAKRGVDVRIAAPHHGDKPIVHATTRSYYRELLASGVRIYEYSAGFLHSKTIVSDRNTAVIGTTNFDYRSLYLHFECGVLMFGSHAVAQLYDDYVNMLPVCTEIKEENLKNGIIRRTMTAILKIFAPLM